MCSRSMGTDSANPRQRVVRVGSRRAKLTAAPGTFAEPAVTQDEAAAPVSAGEGPNDARLRQDVPPHY